MVGLWDRRSAAERISGLLPDPATALSEVDVKMPARRGLLVLMERGCIREGHGLSSAANKLSGRATGADGGCSKGAGEERGLRAVEGG